MTTTVELIDRTKLFAHRCVKFSLSLPKNDLGNHIRKQLIRSSTSVAANYRAAVLGQSKAAFKAKLSIVLEEVDESQFWIEFSLDEKIVNSAKTKDLFIEANELKSIFFVSRKTMNSGK